ncbi:hypothetical protein NLG97_g2239 [Lecanicillium saksenae]|uniref:Uncharacterized protein n=1 Tax=Lecanicillium saksenae TaxID=468837 RepID=A0ACC1R437_9HYPO|nr:hypothetical protein NLG97_g2239 [Lecanicillium saksenae]
MAAMASQHLPASIPHGSNTDTDTDTVSVSVSVSSQLDSSNRQTLPPANHPAASSELDDELDSLDTLDSLVDDQFHHRFPDYHEHHHHSSHRSQTHHDARHSTNGSIQVDREHRQRCH